MLLDQIQSDLREAQLNRDEIKVSALRMLLAEALNAKIAKGQDLSDEDVVSVIRREVKKRKEAAESFRAGQREEAAAKEEKELMILQAFLPAQMGSEELSKLVEETIKEVGGAGIADMGKVMGAVMGKVKGQADGGTVSTMVKQKLSKQ